MNMYRRLSPPDYIIYGLLVVGIVSRFIMNPKPLLLPLLVFGAIFLLYKYPPNRHNKRGRTRVIRGKPSARQQRQDDKARRKSNFRVIYGNKPDSEDDPPR